MTHRDDGDRQAVLKLRALEAEKKQTGASAAGAELPREPHILTEEEVRAARAKM